MEIIEYNDSYLNDISNLLVGLEEYIVSIDKDNLDKIDKDYRDKYPKKVLEELQKYNGVCYLAKDSDKIVGLIMGIISEYDEYDYLDYKCPKRGIVTELIVTKNTQSKGIGSLLLEKIEAYFRDKNCEYVLVDAFAYNTNAINFYNNHNYHARMITNIKKI